MKLKRECLQPFRGTLTLGMLWLVTSAVCTQTQPRSFSADQVRTMLNRTTTAKVYFTPDAVRVDGMDSRGNEVTQIMRFDQKVMWSLIPAQKKYMELPGFAFDWASWADEKGVQRESLGMEQLGEYHCEKFRVRRMVLGHAATSVEWDAKELDGLPVKTQDEAGTWSNELRNVRVGPQDPSLFEIPSGYQKLPSGSPHKSGN